MPETSKYRYLLWSVLFVGAFAAIPLLSAAVPFFWDGILNSKIATWYYSTGFREVIIPEDLDAGHPPFFALYLAFIWKVFGRDLFISHLAMVPVLAGLGWQLLLLAKRYADIKALPLVLLFFLLEPALLAHSILISSELVALFFFFLALNSLLNDRKLLLSLAIAGLMLVTLRGMIMAFALLACQLSIYYLREEKISWKIVVPYLSGTLPFIAWIFYHKVATGWYISTESVNWKEDRNFAGLFLMLKNAVAVVRNYLDQGRVAITIVAAFLAIHLWIRRYKLSGQILELAVLAFLPAFIYGASFIPFSNPVGARYFISSFPLVSLFVLIGMKQLTEWDKPVKAALLGLSFVFLCSGHFWIYPDHISKPWDCSLSSIAYFKARDEINTYIFERKIPSESIGTLFPYYSARYTDLLNSHDNFARYDLKKSKYIILTNISHFSKEEFEEIKENWILVKKSGGWPVYVSLYRNPGYQDK